MYYLEWRENRKRIRRAAGKDATDVNNHRLAKQAELNAINNSLALVPEAGGSRVMLRTAIAHYLEEIKITKKPKTLLAYTTVLDYFSMSCRRLFIHDVERADLLKSRHACAMRRNNRPGVPGNKFAMWCRF